MMVMVSIIMPMFNSEQFVKEAIESVLAQTFVDWELLIVDDCSSDSSLAIAQQFAAVDQRIRVYGNDVNLGAASSRNRALDIADGRFVAYLDSDDYWLPEKLQKQLLFSIGHSEPVTITSYATVWENETRVNCIRVPARTSRHQFLIRPPTCTHTILIDTKVVAKSLLRMPPLERRQDAATWLNVLSAGHTLRGMPDELAVNRKRAGSLSSNRMAAVRGTWYLYRDVERLSFPYAAYCLVRQVMNAIWKRRSVKYSVRRAAIGRPG